MTHDVTTSCSQFHVWLPEQRRWRLIGERSRPGTQMETGYVKPGWPGGPLLTFGERVRKEYLARYAVNEFNVRVVIP
jgi:hypothetical protein